MTALALAPEASDEAAFANELGRLLPTGQRLAFAMLQNEDEADDAVQDAAFKAWRARRRFREGAALRPWFLTIVANECRQRRRNRWWFVQKLGMLPDREATADERLPIEDLRSALRRLPTDRRLVLVLRYYLDLPFPEIGRIVGCSPQAAKSRTHRALVELRLEIPEDLET